MVSLAYHSSYHSDSCVVVLGESHDSTLPCCPECRSTAFGTFRYHDLILGCMESLRPAHAEHKRIALCHHIKAGVANGQAGQMKDLLLAALESNRKASLRDPLLEVLLGQVYLCLGCNQEAISCLSQSARRTFDIHEFDWVDRERLVGLSISYLGGEDYLTSITTVSSKHLQLALESLTAARLIDPHHSCEMIFSKSADEIGIAIEVILKAQIHLEAVRAASQALKKQKAIENLALLESKSASPPPLAGNDNASDAINKTEGGSALHNAARRGQLKLVKSLVDSGMDVSQRDNLGNSPLLCAVENSHMEVIRYLADISLWHPTNSSKQSFLPLLFSLLSFDPLFIIEMEDKAQKALDIEYPNPSHTWAAVKYFEKCECPPLDTLMDMVGIWEVKKQALGLFHSVGSDMKRPAASRISTKQALNFVFVGNPGTGRCLLISLLT
jgi:hypothetical protein